MNNPTRTIREIPPEWDRLMRVANAIGYGELRVVIQGGKPVRVESAIKQIKLDNEQDFKEGLDIIPLL
jgi:hypothetical protein